MAKFIKLTEQNGKAVYVNPEFISYIEHARGEVQARFHTTNFATAVRETPEQILALIEAGDKP